MSRTFVKFFVIGSLTVMFWQCQTSGKKDGNPAGKIAQLEETIYGQNGQYTTSEVMELMSLYLRFADSVPENPLSPDYIFKAADISLYQQKGEATIAMYDLIINRYPKHEHAVMSLFLKAFVFDNRLNDTASAHRYYNEFIARYPEHDFADDAEAAIKNLGKSPEELIREFEALNGEEE